MHNFFFLHLIKETLLRLFSQELLFSHCYYFIFFEAVRDYFRSAKSERVLCFLRFRHYFHFSKIKLKPKWSKFHELFRVDIKTLPSWWEHNLIFFEENQQTITETRTKRNLLVEERFWEVFFVEVEFFFI